MADHPRSNPFSPFVQCRRHRPVSPGFDCGAAFDFLSERIGVSAATTYWSQRTNGTSVVQALRWARLQVAVLGRDYPGGLECTAYRVPMGKGKC